MLIYFDTCSLHRRFDDPSQARVRRETEAMRRLLERCEMGLDEMLTSKALETECRNNADDEQRRQTAESLQLSVRNLELDAVILQRAAVLEAAGLTTYDAYHVACAEAGLANRLCTCDDKVLKFARRRRDVAVRVMTPTELLTEIES